MVSLKLVKKGLTLAILASQVLAVAQAQSNPITDLNSTPEQTVIQIGDPIFPDVTSGNTYYMAVKYLKEQGLISGYPDGTFKPNQAINRAEALKVMTKALKYQQFQVAEKPLASQPATTTANTTCQAFPDTPTNSWYFPYLCLAYNYQVVQGYPDGNFHPEQTINKVEALKILLLYGGYKLPALSENFADVKDSDWFANFARVAYQQTLMIGDRQNYLYPADTLTRGDFALLIYRYLKTNNGNFQYGKATFYAASFESQSSASGIPFSSKNHVAAHRTLPFNTKVKVTNLATGASTVVTIIDRGPYVYGHVIDLAAAAFDDIASLSVGRVNVELEVLPPDTTN